MNEPEAPRIIERPLLLRTCDETVRGLAGKVCAAARRTNRNIALWINLEDGAIEVQLATGPFGRALLDASCTNLVRAFVGIYTSHATEGSVVIDIETHDQGRLRWRPEGRRAA